MPPRRWIDKKNAETYSLVHRSQEDPLAQDPDAPQAVLVKVDNLNRKDLKQERRDKYYTGAGSSKVYSGAALAEDESEFREQGMRGNEGEAALYGIEYDDSKYDYMQHLKPIGEDPGAVFISRKDAKARGKKDAALMLKADYAATNHVSLPAELLPSETKIKRTYQDQQEIPDAIAGLQPDMDPRLREVLEALEDEEYVDDDEDIFKELVAGGQAESGDEEADEWDDFDADAHDELRAEEVVPREGEEEWETAFRRFKIQQKNNYDTDSDSLATDEPEDRDTIGPLPGSSAAAGASASAAAAAKKKKKKKIGAKTDLTGFSMSSSALFRNEGLTLLDDRFDHIEKQYNEEDEEEEEPEPFDMAKERRDLESIMDDFLDNYFVEGKKMYKK